MTQVTGTLKPKVEATKPKQFVMIKNCEGGLVVPLEAYDFSTPRRRIAFKFNQDRQYIPVKWAVGVFVTPEATKQMEKGYFTFENLEVLIEMAEEMGYYVPDSIKEPKVTLKEIAKALRDSDIKELEKITSYLTPKIKRDLTKTAQKMYTTLNVSVIEFLEKKLQISLKPVSLDA